MLSPEELLLFKAVKDEQERQEAMDQAGMLGGIGGAALGALGGTVPHKLGNALNRLKGTKPKTVARSLKPGFRMAGGLTGLILGGGLGAGMAAMMKKDSDAGQLLGKIQAQGGEMDEIDQMQLSRLLGDMYNSPSQFM
tara:strand:- start:319 stop:732 length:414 start_codon:yes stop_codon:yes gene_type:complete